MLGGVKLADSEVRGDGQIATPRPAPWADRLIAAVDADNESASTRCHDSRAAAALREAPDWARAQAELTLADFAAAGEAPLEALLADTVARRFTVSVGPARNVLAARMLVPGGPWPGHFGLEAVVFRARQAAMPPWFPPVETPHEPVTFAATIAASAAIRQGHGHVIFPELLAVSEPPHAQGFGIVLIDRLASLYLQHVVPSAAALDWPTPATEPPVQRLRELAFQAHEWGHRAVDARYGGSVSGQRRRLLAVMSEIAADMMALDMLIGADRDEAVEIATTLLLDRVLRDAWLPRQDAHVASLVGRHLLQFLARAGAVTEGPGGPRLELGRLDGATAAELQAIDDVYSAGGEEAVTRYLAGYGWAANGQGVTLASPEPALALVERRVRATQAS